MDIFGIFFEENIFFFQEKASKELLEFNKRREGPILEGDQKFFFETVKDIPDNQLSNWSVGIPFLRNQTSKVMLSKLTNANLISRSEVHKQISLDALNNLNLVVQKGENIVKAKKVGTSKLCPFYKTLYTNMFNREIGQYHCKFLNGFAPKFKTVMYLNHDGAYPNTRMIQFIFQAPPGLTVFTALCQSKNCNVVQKQLIGIILSVK